MVGPLRLVLILALTGGAFAAPRDGLAASPSMKGPTAMSSRAGTEVSSTASHGTQPLLGAIRFFQHYISPIDGARCQFAPTCSAFGYQALRDHGAFIGVLMTADRLMRCSVLTDAADYPRLRNGRLADPVAANLLEK